LYHFEHPKQLFALYTDIHSAIIVSGNYFQQSNQGACFPNLVINYGWNAKGFTFFKTFSHQLPVALFKYMQVEQLSRVNYNAQGE
jgi:hypothetical protein